MPRQRKTLPNLKSKMAAAAILKDWKITISQRWLDHVDKIWNGDVSWPFRPFEKILQFLKFKMTAAAILQNLKTAMSPQWMDQLRQNLASLCASILQTSIANKILRFKNWTWWPIVIWKIKKIMISQYHLHRFQLHFSMLMHNGLL